MKNNDFINDLSKIVKGNINKLKRIKWSEYLKDNLFHEGDELLYLTITGSNLYGMDTDDSDIDIKGVFKPSKKSLITRQKRDQYGPYSSEKENKSDEIELELYSIHKFLDLLMFTGDSNAYDILFSYTNPDCVLYTHPEFEKIQSQNTIDKLTGIKPIRKGLMGYAYGQLKRYETKGFNFNTLKNILKYFKENNYDNNDRLEKYTDELKDFVWSQNKKRKKYTQGDLKKQIKIVPDDKDTYLEINEYKKYPVGIRIKQFLEAIQKWTKEYGSRVKDNDDGIDWKSISHAFRILEEIDSILETRKIQFPLLKAEKLLKIKKGEFGFKRVVSHLDKKLKGIGNRLGNTNDLEKTPYYFYKKQFILDLYNEST